MLNVILTKDVQNVGGAGEVVRVRPGFARNYLLPRGLALPSTKQNVAELEQRRRKIAAEQARLRAEQEQAAGALKSVSVTILRRRGQDERLFGSVNSKDIVDALEAQGVKLDRRLVHLDSPIKTIGDHKVKVRFAADLEIELAVRVAQIAK